MKKDEEIERLKVKELINMEKKALEDHKQELLSLLKREEENLS